jgi:hypothetical protein
VLRMVAGLCVVLTLTGAYAAEFLTRDPLKAFVYSEYPLGDDYFIRAPRHRYLSLSPNKGPASVRGVAPSEISIWGNRTGPWEVPTKLRRHVRLCGDHALQ